MARIFITGTTDGLGLAASDDPAAMVSGRYWCNLRQEQPSGGVMDVAFQNDWSVSSAILPAWRCLKRYVAFSLLGTLRSS